MSERHQHYCPECEHWWIHEPAPELGGKCLYVGDVAECGMCLDNEAVAKAAEGA